MLVFVRQDFVPIQRVGPYVEIVNALYVTVLEKKSQSMIFPVLVLVYADGRPPLGPVLLRGARSWRKCWVTADKRIKEFDLESVMRRLLL